MKLLLVAALVAVAAAAPKSKGLVTPGAAGSAPVIIEPEPIAIGPAVIDQFEPVAIGPALIDHFEPVAIGPALIDQYPAAPAPAATPTASLVQIILNINAPKPPVRPVAVPQPKPDPVHVVESAPELPASPVQVVETAPVLPEPVVILPEELN